MSEIKKNLNQRLDKISEKFVKELNYAGYDELKVENIFKSYVNNVDKISLVSNFLENAFENDYFGITGSTESKILIANTNHYSLYINMISNTEDKNYLHSLHSTNFFSPIVYNGTFDIHKYRQNKATNYTIFDKECNLDFDKIISLKEGDILKIESWKDVVLFDTKNSTVCFFDLQSRDTLDFVWEYDKTTLNPLRIISANTNLSRTEISLRIMSDIGNRDSIDIAKKYSAHTRHTLRWEAAKCLINLDFERGKETLLDLTEDEHPEIQKAATQSLKYL